MTMITVPFASNVKLKLGMVSQEINGLSDKPFLTLLLLQSVGDLTLFFEQLLLGTSTRALIRSAVQFWQDNTCLSFAENGAGANTLVFNQGSGCYSYVGRVYFQSQQEVSIGNGCELVR